MMAFRIAVAGVRLGVFDALADGPRTAKDLATVLSTDPHALELLLDALCSVGYLRHDGRTYANGVAAEPLRAGYRDIMLFWHILVGRLWEDLEESIRTGRPTVDFYTWMADRPETLAKFQDLQRVVVDWLARDIVEAVPLPAGATRLLDLGGGHGSFSVAYCQKYGDLSATVVDRPEVLVIAGETATAAGLSDRVTLHGADLRGEVEFRDQDAVLLFRMIHTFPADQARALIRGAADALRPGGKLIVLERYPDPDAGVVENAFSHCFALNLHHTQGGRLHSPAELAAWIGEAGCTPPQRVVLKDSPSHVLLVASK
ncbi:hydroxyindole O-methyltransferase [Sinosporangium siamense]|uniref:Hydroxyindole O-methyltransferase n=2 Tax=Sinosporangium siamense TaxID=1367973 RepID=A0A919RR65_9ACTN|nr:hydroxyindole O-methyltransferase [Sinosporangium siamense]